MYVSRSIPTAVKRAVLARDGLKCVWCSAPVAPRGCGPSRPDELHFDHVEPWAAGGGHTVDNVVVACRDCNLRRSGPRHSIRLDVVAVEYRAGGYWWPEGFRPPRLVSPDRCAVRIERAVDRRNPLARLVRMVHRGDLPATGPGEPIHVDLPDGWGQDTFARRRLRL